MPGYPMQEVIPVGQLAFFPVRGAWLFPRSTPLLQGQPRLMGGVWYYQARVDYPGGSCRLSSVWELDVIHTSNPLDEYPGDS